MKLIVGLGNPGRIYKNSRHNIGFSVLDALAKSQEIVFKKEADVYSWTAKLVDGSKKTPAPHLVLAQPQTFMNLSGFSVRALLKKYKVGLEDLLVVCDDLDLELGRIKIKGCGSSAGHRGIKSIIGTLKSSNFCRLRLGIGRPDIGRDAAAYVLSAFTREEKKTVKCAIDNACECIKIWVAQGITPAMDRFNKRIVTSKDFENRK